MKVEEGLTIQNKWNSRLYKIIKLFPSKVVLERNDGSNFEIAISELNFSYRNIK